MVNTITLKSMRHWGNEVLPDPLGKVSKVVGLTIESIGPSAKLNDLCLIRSNTKEEPVKAEVVGFRDDQGFF